MKKKSHATTEKNENKLKQNQTIENPVETKKENSEDSRKVIENLETEVKSLHSKIEELTLHNQKLLKEKEDNYHLYLKTAKEKQETYYIMKDLEEKQLKKSMQDIIFIAKQLYYVLKNIPQSNNDIKEFYNLREIILKRLSDSYGVTTYSPQMGAKFDPTKERALSVERTIDKNKNETIASVLSDAFIKDNKIISEALVCVFQFEEENIISN